jgi:hypothetical protein
MKFLIGLKNAGFLGGIFVPLKEKLKKSKLQSILTFFSFSVIISFRVRKQEMAIDLFEPVSVTYDRKSFVDRGF